MNFVKQTALSLGFDGCGIAKAIELYDDKKFMEEWLSKGNQADMNYLARNFDKRTDPRILVPGCKSVVAVIMNYFPEKLQNSKNPQIAKYAYSETDYHIVLKKKLNELEQHVIAEYGHDCVSDKYQHSFTDSAPVLERRWAERGGLGWIGKNTQLINPKLGSYFFIGILMLNIELEYDSPVRPRCGTCTRCIEACPTNALSEGALNARRCISYQTIENKNEIDTDIIPLLSGYAVGCDICADVCPWNKKWAHPHNNEELKPFSNLYNWNNTDWQNLTQTDFKNTFKNSAIQRVGFKKLKYTIEKLIPT